MSETAEDWEMFECANCGDVHRPDAVCYCGCRKWGGRQDRTPLVATTQRAVITFVTVTYGINPSRNPRTQVHNSCAWSKQIRRDHAAGAQIGHGPTSPPTRDREHDCVGAALSRGKQSRAPHPQIRATFRPSHSRASTRPQDGMRISSPLWKSTSKTQVLNGLRMTHFALDR
jgi:hypothetical protein